ncbi:MAG: tetracycline resistance MFS efflux pump [Sphingobacteriales bacterium 17-39-43]|uniref:TCR/Tet family MFS transporter n=1 Tax=Daejeonella sp. TaxID=2805397 RepID=UPI000BC8148D|nr:TCR/Tet family MFS transporter [Daejeonella sp.]OYZ32426.1 MAG: tetracycline resistance MFS efflux pump [Sphingobacteriales bacterium 16-39-50]OYZ59814.1 MAG: tetracycline resistance MFS efflux pump [Sphingobacteriales bacterium 24-40-4]OZA25789.1 MAG: tetracycline resistance MFS efflux pump [Sphingobacteriales bacterium 17-39-43]OZA62213.1 MAG: tetracycline resistance MFS efflux pump [Sphingobacteriales bacterium 39-40-5]HQS04256.1 TCR/Tet family MFS transporter [Daejeonella sp.]
MPKSRKAAVSFIFVTLLLDVIGLGLIIPVFPQLIEELIQGNISEASQWAGLLTFAYAIMQFICAPIVGNLSDKYGRRPVLLLSLLGFGIDYIFLSMAPTIWWLFVGRLIAGLFGASFTTATAYIADISTPENRAKNFGMIGAAFGLGFIIGPGIGGLLGEFGPRVPFMAAAILTFLNLIYGYFVLPESLAKEHRRPFEWKRANPLGSLIQLKKYKGVGGLIVSLIFVYIAGHAVQSTWTFFNIEKFQWSNTLMGISLTVIGLLIAIVQGGLIRYINPRLGDEKSIYVGLGLYSLGLFLFSFATEGWMMFVFLIPYCLGGIAGPALQSIISGNVPRNEQGELQGALTSLMSATSIVGPLLMTNLFAWFTRPEGDIKFAGAPFFAGAILMLISAVVAARSMKKEAFLNRKTIHDKEPINPVQ